MSDSIRDNCHMSIHSCFYVTRMYLFKFNGSVFCFASYSSCGPYEFNDIVSSFKFSQEALVLVIDVGPTMHGILPEIGKVCSLLIEKKVYPAPLSLQLKHSCKSLDKFVHAY